MYETKKSLLLCVSFLFALCLITNVNAFNWDNLTMYWDMNELTGNPINKISTPVLINVGGVGTGIGVNATSRGGNGTSFSNTTLSYASGTLRSVNLWFKGNSTYVAGTTFFQEADVTPLRQILIARTSANVTTFTSNRGANAIITCSNTDMSIDGKWNMITWALNTTNYLVYFNGALCNSTAGASTTQTYVQVNIIPKNLYIDEVSVFKRFLSDTEVKELYQFGTSLDYLEQPNFYINATDYLNQTNQISQVNGTIGGNFYSNLPSPFTNIILTNISFSPLDTSIYLNSPSYVPINTTISLLANYIANFLKTNTIILNVYNELTQAVITQPITFTAYGQNTGYSTYKTTSTGTTNFENLPADTYLLKTTGANYSTRFTYFTLNNNAINPQNIYLMPNGTAPVQINIVDTQGNAVNNATIIITKLINNSAVSLEQQNTGISNYIVAFLNQYDTYGFTISAPTYDTRVASLFIVYDLYTITLTQQSTINFTKLLLDDVSYSITPTTQLQTANSLVNFTIYVTSPSGQINTFGMKNSTTTISTTNSAMGGSATMQLNVTNPITLNYFFTTTNGIIFSKNITYYSDILTSDSTSLNNFGNTYISTINPLFRLLFVLIFSLLVGLLLVHFIGSMGASMVAYITILAFGIMGWIPIVLPILLGIVLIGGFIVFGQGEP